MMKNDKNKEKTILYIIAILLVIIVFLIVLIVNKKRENRELEIQELEAAQENEMLNPTILATLQNMEERDRMEYYFGEFLDYIEDENYEKAYSLLYEDFRENYFPTLEDFEEYIKKTFSDMMNIEHTNIERNGDVYVLWISISDAINGKPGEEKEMNIVIKENDYNDFVLSFSVI